VLQGDWLDSWLLMTTMNDAQGPAFGGACSIFVAGLSNSRRHKARLLR